MNCFSGNSFLKNILLECKKILAKEGLSTQLEYGKLYNCKIDYFNFSVLLSGYEKGRIFDMNDVNEENIEYLDFFNRFIKIKDKKSQFKIFIGEINEIRINNIQIFELVNIVYKASSKEEQYDLPTIFNLNPNYSADIPLNNFYMLSHNSVIKTLLCRSSIDNLKNIRIIQKINLNDYLFRYKITISMKNKNEDEIEELCFCNQLANMCKIKKFLEYFNVSENKLHKIYKLIEDLYFECYPDNDSMIMKMKLENNFKEEHETYIKFLENSIGISQNDFHEYFYIFIKNKFGDNLINNIDIICNMVNSIISGFRHKISRNFINSIKNSVYMVQGKEYHYQDFKHEYYMQVYKEFKNNNNKKWEELICGCGRKEIHKINSHPEQERIYQKPINFYETNVSVETLEKYPPGVYGFSKFYEIQGSFWVNFVGYFFKFCEVKKNFDKNIDKNIYKNINEKLINSIKICSIMSPFLDTLMNFDVKLKIFNELNKLYLQEIIS